MIYSGDDWMVWGINETSIVFAVLVRGYKCCTI